MISKYVLEHIQHEYNYQFICTGEKSTRICGINDRTCYGKIESGLSATENKCKCLMSCNSLNYDIEMKQLSFGG